MGRTAVLLLPTLLSAMASACAVDGSVDDAYVAGASTGGEAVASGQGGTASGVPSTSGGAAGNSGGAPGGKAGTGSLAGNVGSGGRPSSGGSGDGGATGTPVAGSNGSSGSAGTSSSGGSDPGTNVDCSKVGGGTCPSMGSLSCPGGMQCGCQVVAGLGQNKCALLQVGGDRYFLAAAMIETEDLDATSYPPGDVYPNGSGKTGDAYNAGVCKQNWGMMRQCYGPWQGLGQNDYQTSLPLRTDKALDFKVYQTCRAHFADKWWAGHRNGSAGLQNPNTQDIKNFKAGMDWTHERLVGHEADNVRFWVTLPAISYLPPTTE